MSQNTKTPGHNQPEKEACLLVLEDGKAYLGKNFGAKGTSTGEIVFNTSLTGYQEVLTDPSYAGQVVTLTYPEIGNYGTNAQDMESKKIFARGLVIRHLSNKYSSWRADTTLSDFLDKQNIIGISDIDTRSLTRHIRDKGAMRCALSTEILDPDKLLEVALKSKEMTGADFTAEVTTQEPYQLGSGKFKVAVMDFGAKRNILNNLIAHDMTITVYPANTSAKTILDSKPDGIFLSNGPGDPAACHEILQEIPHLISSHLPIFGICLGHQLLSIAFGAKTYKLKFGHRGGNQPVKDLLTGKVEVTCQNHGFAVDANTLPKDLELTHVNLNDNSVEGFRHRSLPIFCVQYHPESSPGPHDSNYLFGRFLELLKTKSK